MLNHYFYMYMIIYSKCLDYILSFFTKIHFSFFIIVIINIVIFLLSSMFLLYNSCSFSWKFYILYFDIYRWRGLSCTWPYYRLTYRRLLFTCDIPKTKLNKKNKRRKRIRKGMKIDWTIKL